MVNYNIEEIRQLKIKLHVALLKKPNKELTNNEVDIAYALSKDKAIQDVLSKAREKTNSEGSE